MNRLCIYMTYNKENKIYEYMGKVLQELKLCCTNIYLVCNYENIMDGFEYVQPYVDTIFYRENVGYDSGAYKDVLSNVLGWDEVYKYDEIVLVNDSFFGFFYPLQDAFRLMEQENCDFWGITGQTAGELNKPFYKFDAHIHSYFLVFKKSIVKSVIFRNFWEALEYPKRFRDAVVNFEIGINAYLKHYGFKGKSFIDIYNIELAKNEIPFLSMPFRLISEYKIPILKKKSILIRNVGFTDTLKAIQYLEQENEYPISWIIEFVEKQFYIPQLEGKVCNSLEVFYKNHASVYIYGAGVCGKNILAYFAYKGWECKGVICTEYKEGEEGVMGIDEAEITHESGIIISVLNQEIAMEIMKHIGNRCRREQLFLISDCSAIKLPD